VQAQTSNPQVIIITNLIIPAIIPREIDKIKAAKSDPPPYNGLR
jgi:hypothetical protein